MKAFGIWLAIVAVLFGGFALVTTLLRETTRVYVFVDTSNQMAPFSRQLTSELDRIDDQERAEFALALGQDLSGAELVHSWQSSLAFPLGEQLFAPCSFDGADQYPEATDADERILITVAGSDCTTEQFADWQVVELE